jgi:hypothetical protein
MYLLGIKEMPNGLGDVVHFPVALLPPTLKVPSLAVIAIICKPKFRPNEMYVLVVDNHPAIIVDGMMPHRPDRQYTEQERRAQRQRTSQCQGGYLGSRDRR